MKKRDTFHLHTLYNYIFLLFFIFHTGVFAKQVHKISILEPSNYDIISSNVTSVVVKIHDKSIKKLKFISESGEMYEEKINHKRDTYCKSIALGYGSNTIIIRAYTSKKKVVDAMLEVYYKFPAYRNFKYPPPPFKKTHFHTNKNEKICAKCHKMTMNEVEDFAFENPKESNCFTCHKSLFENKKYAHAPSTNWICSVCHKKNTSSQTKYPSLKGQKAIMKVCFSCHEDYKQRYLSKRYKHEPIFTEGCTRCHNPHASKNKYFLRLSLPALCVQCHGNKKRTTKKEGTKCAASSKGICTDCHNPHFSEKKFMYEPNRHNQSYDQQRTQWINE